MGQTKMDEFERELIAYGLQIKTKVIPDGRVHRVSMEDERPSKKSGWYIFHKTHGFYGDWRIGETQIWSEERSLPKNQIDRQKICQERKRKAEEYDKSIAQKHDKAALQCGRKWKALFPADPNHPYLVKKRIFPHGVRQAGSLLIIPMYDIEGRLRNLQTIDNAGKKLFANSAQVTGTFSLIPADGDLLVVCEGFATGATIAEREGGQVYVAFNRINLKSVAKKLRSRFPLFEIKIAGDDDWRTKGNPGVQAAYEAAYEIGGYAEIPNFAKLKYRGEKDTDFNDFYNRLDAEG